MTVSLILVLPSRELSGTSEYPLVSSSNGLVMDKRFVPEAEGGVI